MGRPVLSLRSRRPLRPRAELGPGMASGCQDRGVGVVVRRLSSPDDGNLPRQHPAASSVGRGDPRARETQGSQSRWLDQLRGEPSALPGAAGRRHAQALPSGRCARPAVDKRPGSPAGRRRAPQSGSCHSHPGWRPGTATRLGWTHAFSCPGLHGLWVTGGARGRTGPGPGGITAPISLMRKLRLRERLAPSAPYRMTEAGFEPNAC